MAEQGPVIAMIAAMARNRVIGANGGLPWNLPADMRHFVRTTKGKPVIMGRRNYEDIGGPLPKRQNIILSRQSDYPAPGCTIVSNVDEALQMADEAAEVMVIGGQQIYELFLPRCDRLYLTYVDATIEGDTFFPEIDPSAWVPVEWQDRPPDEANPYSMTFVVLDREPVTG